MQYNSRRGSMNQIGLTFILIFISLILSSCGLKLSSSGPNAPNSNPNEDGIRYFLPEDIVVVNASKEVKFGKKLTFHLDRDVDPQTATYGSCFTIPDTAERLSENITSIDVEFKTVADKSRYYTIKTSTNWYSSGEISIQRNNSGLLTGIKLDSKGKLDEIAVETVKTVASIAGTIAGIPDFSSIDIAGGVEAKSLVPCNKFINSVATAKGFGTDFSSLEPVLQYAVFSDAIAQAEWINVIKEKDQLRKLLEQQHSLLNTIPATLTDAIIDNYDKSSSFLSDQIKLSRDRLKTHETAFTESLERVTKSLKIGVTSTTTQDISYAQPVGFWFKDYTSVDKSNFINEIGHDVVLIPLASLPGTNPASSTGQAQAGKDPEVSSSQPPQDKNSSETEQNSEKYDHSDGLIFYRDKTPYLYEIRKKKGGSDTIVKGGYVELFSRETSPGYVRFVTSSTGDRVLTLNFGKSNEEGETVENTYALNSATLTYTSSGLATATAAYNSVTGAVSEYDKALTSVYSIKTKRRAEELAQIDHEVSKKTKQIALLEKSLELKGATESSDLYLEKIKLDYEIQTLLERKKKLVAEFDIEQYVETRDQALQNEVLKTQLEVLQNQLKIRQQLEALEKQ